MVTVSIHFNANLLMTWCFEINLINFINFITANMLVAIPSTSAPSLDPAQADITLPDLVVNQ